MLNNKDITDIIPFLAGIVEFSYVIVVRRFRDESVDHYGKMPTLNVLPSRNRSIPTAIETKLD